MESSAYLNSGASKRIPFQDIAVTDSNQAHSSPQFEAEVIPGLETFAIDELQKRFGPEVYHVRILRAGFIRFQYGGQAKKLRELRSVIALYQVHDFLIPRPKALLGHQHFARLTSILAEAALSFERPPRTFGIGAAGSGSSVMRRLQQALSAALALAPADDGKGELFMRILPKRDAIGWEALLRISALPLSARAYRVVNMPGSLNATVAYALTTIKALGDRALVVNICSGTSTILIEHGLAHPQHQLLAIDSNAAALADGMRNASASGLATRIQHIQADAGRAPLPDDSADHLYADLPFGHQIGSHEANIQLYPEILREAARLARNGAVFIVFTHEVKLLRRSLKRSPWREESAFRLNLRGLHPRIFVLRRNSTRI